MKKHVLKIIYTLLALIIIGSSYYLIKKPATTKDEGEIIIILVDEFKEEVSQKITFKKGDTLIALLNDHYDIKIKQGFLMKIDHLETTNVEHHFIKIMVNDAMANVGIENIKLKDGDKITFIYTIIGA